MQPPPAAARPARSSSGRSGGGGGAGGGGSGAGGAARGAADTESLQQELGQLRLSDGSSRSKERKSGGARGSERKEPPPAAAAGGGGGAGAGVDSEREMYVPEKVIGNGSFGVVFQAFHKETKEVVAIKKVLQDRRFKVRARSAAASPRRRPPPLHASPGPALSFSAGAEGLSRRLPARRTASCRSCATWTTPTSWA